MFKWFKSLSWITLLGAAASGAYLVFNAVRASQLEAQADANQQKMEGMIQAGTTTELKKAEKLFEGLS